jgi:hypothetical protein
MTDILPLAIIAWLFYFGFFVWAIRKRSVLRSIVPGIILLIPSGLILFLAFYQPPARLNFPPPPLPDIVWWK